MVVPPLYKLTLIPFVVTVLSLLNVVIPVNDVAPLIKTYVHPVTFVVVFRAEVFAGSVIPE